jgi:hypothetical protein
MGHVNALGLVAMRGMARAAVLLSQNCATNPWTACGLDWTSAFRLASSPTFQVVRSRTGNNIFSSVKYVYACLRIPE